MRSVFRRLMADILMKTENSLQCCYCRLNLKRFSNYFRVNFPILMKAIISVQS